MFLRRNKRAARDLLIGLDLGARQIKAVVLQRDGSNLKLTQYAVIPSTAAAGEAGGAQRLGAEIQEVISKLGVTGRSTNPPMNSPPARVSAAQYPKPG